MKQPFEKVRLWQTHFTVLRPLKNLIVPDLVVYEEQISKSYCCDGRKRFEDGSQVVITIHGRGAIRVHGVTHALEPGRVFLHNHNDPEVCYFYPEDGVEPWNFLWIAFWGGNSAELVSEINSNSGYIFDSSVDSPLVRMLMEYKSYSSEVHILTPWEGACLVNNILKELCLPDSSRANTSGNAVLIGAVQSLINSSPGKDWNIEKLAARFNVSREHLSRVFAQETNLTLHEYITRLRLRMAVSFLLHTRLSGKEIADRCGWHDYSNFYRIFKGRFGHAPHEVRTLKIRPQI